MARIPGAEQLGDRPSIKPQRTVQGYDASAIPDAANYNAQQLGKTADILGTEAARQQDEYVKLQLAQSQAALLTKSADALAEAQQNPDPTTIKQTYDAAMKTAQGDIEQNITGSARARQLFKSEAQLHIAQQTDNLNTLIRQKTVDQSKASTLQTLSNTQISAAHTPEGPLFQNLIQATHDTIKSNPNLTEVEKVEWAKKWDRETSDTRAKVLLQSPDGIKQLQQLMGLQESNPKPQSSAAPSNFEQLSQAVIQQESGGRADALNTTTSTGQPSVGLMQLQPGTAKEMATKLGVPYDAKRLQSDPAYNKQLGQEYLKTMLAKYDGNQTLALAAYNAGPKNVDKWIGKFGDPRTGAISNEEFTNKIPFTETQNYVVNVSANAPAQTASAEVSSQPTIPNQQGNWTDYLSNPGEVQKAMEVATLRNERLREAAVKQEQEKTMNGMFDKAYSPNGLDPAEIVGNQNLTFEQRAKMMEMVHTVAQRGAATDPGTFNDLFLKINAGQITSREELIPWVGHGITPKDVGDLTKEIEGDGTPIGDLKKEFFKTAYKRISASNLLKNDPAGEAAYYNWYSYLTDPKSGLIAEKRKAGVPEGDLFRVGSKDYIGDTVDMFTRPLSQQVKDKLDAMRKQSKAAPTPEGKMRKPGETAIEYYKRMHE